MPAPTPIKTVAVIGTGVIGASWAALYLSRGLRVIASDPAPGAEEKFKKTIEEFWPALKTLGLASDASVDKWEFITDLSKGDLQKVDFVQENGPERVDVKRKLFAQLDAATRPDVVLASSSSGLPASTFIQDCKHPERVLIAHPFNPPHIIPLVEVVPTPSTAPEYVTATMDFYKFLGKHPILVKKEVPGHIANRLQAALNVEAFSLVNRGIISAVDIDAAVTEGPGLRWGLSGPFMLGHIGGGGGENGFINIQRHIGGAAQEWLKDMRQYPWNGEEAELLNIDKSFKEGLAESGTNPDLVMKESREVLVELIQLKKEKSSLAGSPSPAATGTSVHTNPKALTSVSAGGDSGRVVFLNIVKGEVLTCNTDGKDLKTLVSGLKTLPDGVQVDVRPGHQHIYWTDMGRHPKRNDGLIQRCDLDGGHVTTILPEGSSHTPKQLVLDASTERLYWCDREGMRVMRCKTDGSELETLIVAGTTEDERTNGRYWPVGIALDTSRGLIYWTQKGNSKAGAGRIFRAKIDIPAGESAEKRTDVETLFDGLPEPIDLELDVKNQILYWVDRGDIPYGNTLNRASVSSVLDAKAKPKGASSDWIVASKFHEAIGLSLDLDHGRVFVSDLLGGLYSMDLDGQNKKTLIEDAGNLTGVTYVDLKA